MADAEGKVDGSLGAVADMLAKGALERRKAAQEALATPVQKPAQKEEVQDDEIQDDEIQNDETHDETPDGGDEGGADDQHAAGDDVSTEESDEEPAEDDDEPQEITYDDDDIVEVLVDGEVLEVTLHDLKAAYSGEGAIDKRLKEATEARKEAVSLRDQMLQQQEESRTRLLQTIAQLDSVLFAPLVEKPSASLRTKNRAAYDEQLDAYEDDQKRIQASRQQMQQFMEQQLAQQQQNRQAYRDEQQRILVEKAGIKKLEDAKAFQDDIKLAADHYGFSQAQINEVDNAGVFLMARDAARYLKLQKVKQQANGKSPTAGKPKVRRKLKAGGPTSKKLEAQRQAQRKQEAVSKAKSGKINDIADMISASARKRG